MQNYLITIYGCLVLISAIWLTIYFEKIYIKGYSPWANTIAFIICSFLLLGLILFEGDIEALYYDIKRHYIMQRNRKRFMRYINEQIEKDNSVDKE